MNVGLPARPWCSLSLGGALVAAAVQLPRGFLGGNWACLGAGRIRKLVRHVGRVVWAILVDLGAAERQPRGARRVVLGCMRTGALGSALCDLGIVVECCYWIDGGFRRLRKNRGVRLDKRDWVGKVLWGRKGWQLLREGIRGKNGVHLWLVLILSNRFSSSLLVTASKYY